MTPPKPPTDALRRLLRPVRRHVATALSVLRPLSRMRLMSRRWTAGRDKRRFPVAPSGVGTDARHGCAAAQALGRPALFAGSTQRFATASGVTWASDDVVMVAYLLTSSIVVYRLVGNGLARSLTAVADVSNLGGLGDFANISSSADGQLVGVTSTRDGRVGVLRLDGRGIPRQDSLALFGLAQDRTVHGIAFSPDSRFLAYTSVDNPGGLRVLNIENGDAGAVKLDLVQDEVNRHPSLKPKGVEFTANGKFVIVSYGGNATAFSKRAKPGFVAVHEWSARTGRIGPEVSRSDSSLRIPCAEDICLIDGGSRVVATDHYRDAVYALNLDPHSGVLGAGRKVISWSAGGLQSPHGCAVSPDGSTLAVTNYGDGSVRLFRTSDLLTSEG